MEHNKLNIALIGYGKMGKTIESVALQRGHQIGCIVSRESAGSMSDGRLRNIDAAIEFSIPEAAGDNLMSLAENNVPTVCGTTGWLDRYDEIAAAFTEKETSFLYASNFSIGVNIFFSINKYLAKIIGNVPAYDVSMLESHHITKVDAPSGTAITLANQIIEAHPYKSKWVGAEANAEQSIESAIPIESIREADVKGMHQINYTSEIDEITIKHEAFSRKGFALGAVLAAEYIAGKKGIYTMADVLNLNSKD